MPEDIKPTLHKPINLSFIWTLLQFVLGSVCCILHHFFYSSRDGKPVTDRPFGVLENSLQNQKVVSVLGTAFAFVIKALYVSSLELAYQQAAWRVWRKKPFTVEALDTVIALPADATKFATKGIWKYARRPVFIALIIWLSAPGTVFAPGTISVEWSTHISNILQQVPTLDFFALERQQPHGHTELFSVPTDAYGGISPEMDKLRMLTAYGGSIIPGPGTSCGQNCSYTIRFSGPAQKCENIANYTLEENNPWKGGNSFTRNQVYQPRLNSATYYEAKLATNMTEQRDNDLWVSWASRPSDPKDELVILDDVLTITTKSAPQPVFPWVFNTVRCIDYNATYTVDVEYVNGVESLRTSLEYLNKLKYVADSGENLLQRRIYDPDSAPAQYYEVYLHRAAKEALVKTLTGSIYIQIGAFKTRMMTESGISNTALVRPYLVPEVTGVRGLNRTGTVYIPIPNLGRSIEQLSVNLTLTLLGTSGLVYRDPHGAAVMVRMSEGRNQFKYNPKNLILSYAVLTGVTALGVVLGLVAASLNGFWGDTTFASMYVATKGCGREVDINETYKHDASEDVLGRRLRLEVNRDGKPFFTVV